MRGYLLQQGAVRCAMLPRAKGAARAAQRVSELCECGTRMGIPRGYLPGRGQGFLLRSPPPGGGMRGRSGSWCMAPMNAPPLFPRSQAGSLLGLGAVFVGEMYVSVSRRAPTCT